MFAMAENNEPGYRQRKSTSRRSSILKKQDTCFLSEVTETVERINTPSKRRVSFATSTTVRTFEVLPQNSHSSDDSSSSRINYEEDNFGSHPSLLINVKPQHLNGAPSGDKDNVAVSVQDGVDPVGIKDPNQTILFSQLNESDCAMDMTTNVSQLSHSWFNDENCQAEIENKIVDQQNSSGLNSSLHLEQPQIRFPWQIKGADDFEVEKTTIFTTDDEMEITRKVGFPSLSKRFLKSDNGNNMIPNQDHIQTGDHGMMEEMTADMEMTGILETVSIQKRRSVLVDMTDKNLTPIEEVSVSSLYTSVSDQELRSQQNKSGIQNENPSAVENENKINDQQNSSGLNSSLHFDEQEIDFPCLNKRTNCFEVEKTTIFSSTDDGMELTRNVGVPSLSEIFLKSDNGKDVTPNQEHFQTHLSGSRGMINEMTTDMEMTGVIETVSVPKRRSVLFDLTDNKNKNPIEEVFPSQSKGNDDVKVEKTKIFSSTDDDMELTHDVGIQSVSKMFLKSENGKDMIPNQEHFKARLTGNQGTMDEMTTEMDMTGVIETMSVPKRRSVLVDLTDNIEIFPLQNKGANDFKVEKTKIFSSADDDMELTHNYGFPPNSEKGNDTIPNQEHFQMDLTDDHGTINEINVDMDMTGILKTVSVPKRRSVLVDLTDKKNLTPIEEVSVSSLYTSVSDKTLRYQQNKNLNFSQVCAKLESLGSENKSWNSTENLPIAMKNSNPSFLSTPGQLSKVDIQNSQLHMPAVEDNIEDENLSILKQSMVDGIPLGFQELEFEQSSKPDDESLHDSISLSEIAGLRSPLNEDKKEKSISDSSFLRSVFVDENGSNLNCKPASCAEQLSKDISPKVIQYVTEENKTRNIENKESSQNRELSEQDKKRDALRKSLCSEMMFPNLSSKNTVAKCLSKSAKSNSTGDMIVKQNEPKSLSALGGDGSQIQNIDKEFELKEGISQVQLRAVDKILSSELFDAEEMLDEGDCPTLEDCFDPVPNSESVKVPDDEAIEKNKQADESTCEAIDFSDVCHVMGIDINVDQKQDIVAKPVPNNSLNDKLNASFFIRPEITNLEEYVKQLQEECSRLQKLAGDNLEFFSLCPPKIYLDVRSATKQGLDVSSTKSRVQEMARACRGSARSRHNRHRADYLMQLTLAQQNEHTQQKDNLDTILSDIDRIANMSSEIDRCMESLNVVHDTRSEIHDLEKEKARVESETSQARSRCENLDKQIEELNKVSKNHLHKFKEDEEEELLILDQISFLFSMTEWSLLKQSKTKFTFGFLSNTVLLHVSLLDGKQPHQRISDISFKSRLSSKSQPWARLSHALMFSSLKRDRLLNKYHDYSQLNTLLAHLSDLARVSRDLGAELKEVHLKHHISVDGLKIQIRLLSFECHQTIELQASLQPGSCTVQPLDWKVTILLGPLLSSSVVDHLMQVTPGPKYITRSVDAVLSLMAR